MGRTAGVSHPGSIADRAIDLLQIDGGWLTCHGIACDLGEKPQTVQSTLHRLRVRGRVRSRWRDQSMEWSVT